MLPEEACLRLRGAPHESGTFCSEVDCSAADAQNEIDTWHEQYPLNPLAIVVTSSDDTVCTEWLVDTLAASEALGDCPYLMVDEQVFRRLDIEHNGFLVASERTRSLLGDIGSMKWISSDDFPGCPGGPNAGPGSYRQIDLDDGYAGDLRDWASNVLGKYFGTGADVVTQVGFFDFGSHDGTSEHPS